nr:hypothetical protein CDSM653_00781 [Ipomoea batatas]
MFILSFSYASLEIRCSKRRNTFATAVPDPMATPISAFLSAGLYRKTDSLQRAEHIAIWRRQGDCAGISSYIMFVVKVPVLSLQITVVQPKVSTDGRDLTIAFNRAILFVPRARQLYKLKKATLSIQFENKKPYATMQVIHEEDAKSFRWVFCYFPTQQHHFTISETGVQCSLYHAYQDEARTHCGKFHSLNELTEKRMFVLSWYTALVVVAASSSFSTEQLSPVIITDKR